jgi:diacylglycerol kinase (ATP)
VSHAPLIVVNPTAGSGRALRLLPWMRERIELRPDVELRVTSRPGEAEELAAEAADQGHDRVVAVGGDGTVQEVINGLLARGDPARGELGILPIGTGNDLARSLGLPTDPGAAWTIAMGNATRSLDVARATNGEGRQRWFGSAGGIGFDAQVASAMASQRGWRAGRAGYLVTTLTELRRFENRAVRLEIDGVTIERNVLLIAIANGEYYGGGMRIAPGARTDDGRLDICVVGDISRLTAIRQLRNLYRGTHVEHVAVSMHGGSQLSIEGDAATRVHLDGEPFGGLPLRVTLTPDAVRVAARAPTA